MGVVVGRFGCDAKDDDDDEGRVKSNRGIGGRLEENDFKDDFSGFFITTCAACTLGDTAVIVGLEMLLVGATLPPILALFARGVTWSRSFELPRRWGCGLGFDQFE